MEIKGFSFSAVKAGVRYPDRLDLGLIYAESPCTAAGVFTTNKVKAAPLIIAQQRLHSGQAQAILVNSGCANACTGAAGMQNSLKSSSLLSTKLGIEDQLVLLSSTGVIGEQLNLKAFTEHMHALVDGLSADGLEKVARAIMTTDTVHKISQRSLSIGGKKLKIMGMAKGAGMIMPNMATMLAFILTDAEIARPALEKSLISANERTFNRITIDGDTSTNDMVLILANGTAANRSIDEPGSEEQLIFEDALEDLLKDLALQIVRDGEGATKMVTIKVRGAVCEKDAEQLARTVATSSLVKTAFFGEDANWGRILAAMGRSGVEFDPDQVDLFFAEVMLVQRGIGLGRDAEQAATEVLKESDFTVTIDLNSGKAEAEIYTCDFSIDYVKINSDYRS
jgi:glutamate N-acetyltransferase/amino-acid N-acetyltransferase